MVIIPFQATMGMRFGMCTCGKPKMDGVPCKHMAVIAMSSMIEGLTGIQVMPYWWTTVHWQQQYAMEVNCLTDISLKTLKTMSTADEMLRYCPSWVAAQKAGRPKATVHEKSLTDLIQESAKKKHTRRVKMFCQICHEWNHNTVDCFLNPGNDADGQEGTA